MALTLNGKFKAPTTPRAGMPVPDLSRAGAPGPSGEPRLLLFATLHCADCLELLPQLEAAAGVLSMYRTILLLAGDPREVRELATYFGWTFDVYPVQARELQEGMGVQVFPLAILDIGDGRVARAAAVHNKADILALASGLLMKGGD